MVDTNGTDQASEMLWQHPSPEQTLMFDFLQRVSRKHRKEFKTYHELYRWSIDNVADFWGEVWKYCGIRHSQSYRQVVSDAGTMYPRPKWFEGARLNFAENLLFPAHTVDEESLARCLGALKSLLSKRNARRKEKEKDGTSPLVPPPILAVSS